MLSPFPSIRVQLPSGLLLKKHTGRIPGTPTIVESKRVTVKAQNSSSYRIASISFVVQPRLTGNFYSENKNQSVLSGQPISPILPSSFFLDVPTPLSTPFPLDSPSIHQPAASLELSPNYWMNEGFPLFKTAPAAALPTGLTLINDPGVISGTLIPSLPSSPSM